MTIATDNAERFATSDRQTHAEHVLTAAVRQATSLLRTGQPRSDAALVLAKAERSASRILGRAAA